MNRLSSNHLTNMFDNQIPSSHAQASLQTRVCRTAFDKPFDSVNPPLIRDSRDFSPYSSSAEWADKNKTSLSALLEADVEGPAVAGLACFNGLKKEDMEEGPAIEQSAADVEGPAVAGSACLTGLKNE
ncbi:hypothetical protein E2C01_056543 [Portunus trituberculatus]|uniref:Uncharacterized protein n=1 Tax=Portunus trituberculatus TaxID=210409 RepID=A0A5B7GZV2_PORTR|nr:hypothetical protein [Portunus trituberculatus]